MGSPIASLPGVSHGNGCELRGFGVHGTELFPATAVSKLRADIDSPSTEAIPSPIACIVSGCLSELPEGCSGCSPINIASDCDRGRVISPCSAVLVEPDALAWAFGAGLGRS